MAGRVLSLNVVGVDHPNKDGGNRRSEIMFCDPGEPITLTLEPKNPKDENAVAVFTMRGHQIGYLTAERAPWFGSMIREGRPLIAIFQEEAPWGAVIRVGIDGAAPTLPIRKDGPDFEKADQRNADFEGNSDETFWPDYIPPDD